MVLEKVLAILVRRTVRQEGGWCDRRLVLEALQEELAGLLPADRLDHLLDDAVLSGAWPLEAHAGRVIDVTLAERYVFTHRLSAEEISSGALDVDVDLAAISRLAECDGGLHTEDGVRLHHRVRRRKGAGREGLDLRTATVTGPTGWLGRFTADTVVATRAAGGFLTLEPVEGELSAPEDVVSALASLMERAHDGDGTPVDAAELQFAAMVDHPEWFAVPQPPFTTLLEQAGFEVDGDLVGRPGGWADYKALTDMIGAIAGNDLPEHDTSILLDGLKAFDKWKDGARRPAAELSQRLGRHWAAATALFEELRRRRTSPDDLAGFAATFEPPIREWLGAKAAVLQGRTADAEQLAREALRADAGFGPALRLMASFESDRGHAREAVNLLHRVVPHDDEHLITLRRYASAASPSTGRNDPCPCGSGRKFKVCHLGRSLLPDAERVRWLLDKVWLYTVSLNPPDEIDELLGADVMAGALRLDLLVFDEGWLRRFILERGSLLPEAERRWAEGWSTGNVPSVYRLEEVDADGRAVLIDVGTGQRYVVESPALQDFTPGRLLWARLLPVDDKWWTSGIVRPVWLSERADLLAAMAEGTPIDQRYDALAPEDMGPTLTNTSGDPHVFCTTTVVVADPELAVKALDDRLGPREGKELEWATKEDTPSMPQAVTARLELTFEGLLIETNSLRRRAAALALVEDILGPVEIVNDERVPSARARALHEAEELADDFLAEFWDDDDELDGDDDVDFDDDEFDDESPELEQLLAAHKAALDERWLDMEIPALGGLTPRQAANDDTARADLITLLAETDDRGMSVDSAQMRRRLGLSD